MEPVQIIDKKDWSSIDIFLFSNGQQYSPPRKYHLRSEKLQWWGSAMSYLGRTHYGSGHSSIELYTTDGTKINSPLELINGAAYVAVEPPDSFINTGYEEYLLRASRSWEKRLSQKSKDIETLNPEFKFRKNPAVQNNDMNVTRNFTDTTSLKDGTNATTSQKARPNKQRIQKKFLTSPKQIQKKISFDKNSAMLKRMCAETDKVLSGTKKAPPKKNKSINQKPLTVVPRKVNSLTNQELLCKTRCTVKPETCSKTEANRNMYDMAPVREEQMINLFNNEKSDFISLKNDSDLCPIINKSGHIDSENKLIVDKTRIDDQYLSKLDNEENLLKDSTNKLKEIYQCESKNLIKNDFPKNEIDDGCKENVPLNNNNKENKYYDNILNGRTEKQVIDQYIAHMNKGGILLLKLKVKLKDCKTIFNADKSKYITKTSSLSNLPKTEKTSQADINISFSGELLKSNEKQYEQDNSLQSVLNKFCTEQNNQINNKNPRIIILQCACRNYSDYNKCTCDTCYGCEYEDSKCDKPVNLKLNHTVSSCECQNGNLRTSKNEDRPSLLDANDKEVAEIFERSGRTMENDKNQNSNRHKKQNINNTLINGNQEQSIVLTRLNTIQMRDSGSENENGKENNDYHINTDKISKCICCKSVQTEWCNVLLVARRCEDHNYTFHLPSLYILKQYKLC